MSEGKLSGTVTEFLTDKTNKKIFNILPINSSTLHYQNNSCMLWSLTFQINFYTSVETLTKTKSISLPVSNLMLHGQKANFNSHRKPIHDCPIHD